MDEILNQEQHTYIRSMVMAEEGLVVDYDLNKQIIVKPGETLELWVPGRKYWLQIEAIPVANNDKFPEIIGE